MRKLIVCNFVTVDGYYESKDKTIDSMFKYLPEGIRRRPKLRHLQPRAIDDGRHTCAQWPHIFLGNKSYWTSVPSDPNATAVRRQFADLIARVDKIVVSDKITQEEVAPWNNTRIVRVADAAKEIAALKQQPGRDILILLGRILWNHMLQYQLIDELHLTTFPIIAGEGVKLFDGRPPISLRLLGTQTWQGSGNILARWGIDYVTK